MATAVTNSLSSVSTATSTGSANANSMDPTESQDRFLKLLVAQLNNQDPMNPMDNAQMTTQLAQINTVSGIQELNKTVQGLVSQFSQMQMLQGSSLVGHHVLTSGNTISKDGTTGTGAIDLSADASSVSVQVVNASGAVVDTVNLGAQTAGRHSFETDLSKYTSAGELTFKVVALNGTKAVDASTLMTTKVTAIGSDAGGLTLNLSNGKTVGYSSVKAVL
jgi:flagellar basal-body rod modification protein FlgD